MPLIDDAVDGEVPAAVPWRVFREAEPELAARIRARFAANLHHVIGTLRTSGAPRLSGTEVRIDDDAVSFGMMPDSRKLADVRRDPRVEVHSAPLEETLESGDAKLMGRMVPREAFDAEHLDAGYFELLLEGVSLVRVERDELVVASWRPGRPARLIRRR